MSNPTSLRDAVSVDFSNRNFNAFYNGVLLSFKSKRKNHLLLEGSADAKVLKQFFNAGIIAVPCNGRGNVVKVFKRLPKTITNVFGIADKDYDLNPFADFRLFYYDGNNFEMMLFKDDALFDDAFLFNGYKVGKSFSSTELIDLRNTILFNLFPISIFRKINMQVIPEGCKTGVSNVFPNLSLCMQESRDDIACTIRNGLLVHLSKVDCGTVNNIISTFNLSVTDKSIDCFDVTHGHDFVELFKNEIGFPTEGDFYSLLKEAYKKEQFCKTNLYVCLKRYALHQMIDIF